MTGSRAALLSCCVLVACGGEHETRTVHLAGRVEAVTVDLAPKLAGRVVEVTAVEGQRVRAGDLLVRIDLGTTALDVERDAAALGAAEARLQDLERGSREHEIAAARAEVADREAALELARTSFGRAETLLARKVGSQREYDEAAAALERAAAALAASRSKLHLLEEGFREGQKEQARSDVARARTVLEQSRVEAAEAELRAPADAVVLHRIAEPGLLLAAGQNAMTLGFTDRLYVRVFVPETRLGQVRPGSPATVEVDAFPGREFKGRVAEIAPDAEFTPKPVETRAERVHLVYAAKVDLDAGWDAPLVPGQPAEVRVAAAEAPPP